MWTYYYVRTAHMKMWLVLLQLVLGGASIAEGTVTSAGFRRLRDSVPGWSVSPTLAPLETVQESDSPSFLVVCASKCNILGDVCSGFELKPTDGTCNMHGNSMKLVPQEEAADGIFYMKNNRLRILAMHQDTAGGFFPAAAVGHNQNDPGAHLYSILDNIEDFRSSDGKFRFELCYPEIHATECMTWKQTNNPVKTTTMAGFEYVGGPFSQGIFRGLAADSTSKAITDGDGNVPQNWFFAVGAKRFHQVANKFPGPQPNNPNIVTKADVYVTLVL